MPGEVLLATIAERDSDEKVGLCFFDDHAVSRAKVYTMVESNSYYEMYQHVLEALKVLLCFTMVQNLEHVYFLNCNCSKQ